MKKLLQEAKNLQPTLVKLRQDLHEHAETGFQLPKTLKRVQAQLSDWGIAVKACGKSGLVARVGKAKSKNVILLRADMDGLPMVENTKENFACKTGNMHACGHDMHTTMLLGAAQLLKEREANLDGEIRLVFQPAEELLQGAKDMLKAGVLEKPAPKAALALHVSTGVDIPSGKFMISTHETAAPAADYFKIVFKGESCHGATPHKGKDALLAASLTAVALCLLPAREQSVDDAFVLTVGKMQAGTAGNAIADTAVIEGTLRAYSEDTRARVKKRLKEIAAAQAQATQVCVEIVFTGGCPTLKNNLELAKFAKAQVQKLFGEQALIATDGKGGGSEDFAYFSHELPSTLLVLTAGERKAGYEYPLHHPKARFDESVLWQGSALLAHFAIERLKNK